MKKVSKDSNSLNKEYENILFAIERNKSFFSAWEKLDLQLRASFLLWVEQTILEKGKPPELSLIRQELALKGIVVD